MKTKIDWSPPLVKGLIHMGVHLAAFVYFVLKGVRVFKAPIWLDVFVYCVVLAGIVRSVTIIKPYLYKRWPIIRGSRRDDI